MQALWEPVYGMSDAVNRCAWRVVDRLCDILATGRSTMVKDVRELEHEPTLDPTLQVPVGFEMGVETAYRCRHCGSLYIA